MICNRIANLYATYADYRNAIPMYYKAAANYARIGHKRNEMYAYDGLSRALQMTGDVTTSLEILSKTQHLAEELRDTTTILRCAIYHAITLFEELNDPDAALKLVEKVHTQLSKNYSSDVLPLLSEIYLNKGNIAQARRYALQYYDSELSLREQVGVIALLKKIESQGRNYEQYLAYDKQYVQLVDSLYLTEKKNSIFEIKQKYDYQSLADANDNLAKQSRLYWIITGLGVSLFILIICIIGRGIYRRNRQISDYRKAVDEIRSHCNALEEIRAGLNQDNIYLKTILEDKIAVVKEMIEIAGSYRENSEKFLSRFKKYVKTDEKHNLPIIFRNIIEAKQPGILAYLTERYPELTQDDIDLYCMVCGRCSIEVLCLVSDNSSRYIYNKRASLRKKVMREDEKKSFSDHLCELITEYQRKNITFENRV